MRRLELSGKLRHKRACLLHKILGILQVHKPAGNDLRRSGQLSRFLFKQDHHREKPFLRKQFPVAQHNVADLAHAVAIDHYTARGNGAVDPDIVSRKLDDIPDLGNDDVVRRDAHLFRKLRMLVKVARLAMHGDEILGLREREHQPELLAPRMAGNVHVRHAVVNDFCAFLIQLIDDAGNRNLISGDRGCGDDDHVPLADVEPVGSVRHAEQTAHGFSLATGRDDADLFIINLAQLFHFDDLLHGDVQVTELTCHLRNVHHAAALEADHPPVCDRHIRNLLDAVDVGSKCRYDNATLCDLEIVFKGLPNLPL